MSRPATKSICETLPTIISVATLEELSNLTTLHNWLEASTAASRIFDTYGAEIIESVFASGAVHDYTCAIIRLAACVRSGIAPPGVSDLDSFRAMHLYEATQCRYDPPR